MPSSDGARPRPCSGPPTQLRVPAAGLGSGGPHQPCAVSAQSPERREAARSRGNHDTANLCPPAGTRVGCRPLPPRQPQTRLRLTTRGPQQASGPVAGGCTAGPSLPSTPTVHPPPQRPCHPSPRAPGSLWGLPAAVAAPTGAPCKMDVGLAPPPPPRCGPSPHGPSTSDHLGGGRAPPRTSPARTAASARQHCPRRGVSANRSQDRPGRREPEPGAGRPGEQVPPPGAPRRTLRPGTCRPRHCRAGSQARTCPGRARGWRAAPAPAGLGRGCGYSLTRVRAEGPGHRPRPGRRCRHSPCVSGGSRGQGPRAPPRAGSASAGASVRRRRQAGAAAWPERAGGPGSRAQDSPFLLRRRLRTGAFLLYGPAGARAGIFLPFHAGAALRPLGPSAPQRAGGGPPGRRSPTSRVPASSGLQARWYRLPWGAAAGSGGTSENTAWMCRADVTWKQASLCASRSWALGRPGGAAGLRGCGLQSRDGSPQLASTLQPALRDAGATQVQVTADRHPQKGPSRVTWQWRHGGGGQGEGEGRGQGPAKPWSRRPSEGGTPHTAG